MFDNPEGATPLNPEEIQGLKLVHITTRTELNRWEQQNIIDAMERLAKKTPENILTESFVRQLHKIMFGDVWKWAGTYRITDKNIGKNWMFIPSAVKSLCEDTQYWISNRTDSADMIGVRFHHKLVSIHPFPNGNGRHARLMTDLLMGKICSPLFTWGSANLSDQSNSRSRYIEALKAADSGNYSLLISYVRT